MTIPMAGNATTVETAQKENVQTGDCSDGNKMDGKSVSGNVVTVTCNWSLREGSTGLNSLISVFNLDLNKRIKEFAGTDLIDSAGTDVIDGAGTDFKDGAGTDFKDGAGTEFTYGSGEFKVTPEDSDYIPYASFHRPDVEGDAPCVIFIACGGNASLKNKCKNRNANASSEDESNLASFRNKTDFVSTNDAKTISKVEIVCNARHCELYYGNNVRASCHGNGATATSHGNGATAPSLGDYIASFPGELVENGVFFHAIDLTSASPFTSKSAPDFSPDSAPAFGLKFASMKNKYQQISTNFVVYQISVHLNAHQKLENRKHRTTML